MPAQFDYVEMKENYNIQDTRENQESKDTAEKIPIIKSKERYETIESEPTEDQSDDSDMESETLTGQVFFQLLACILAFFSRGLVFNPVGPTLIDLMQVASISLEKGAWLFASQSVGFVISCLIAKVVYIEFNEHFTLFVCLTLKAVFTALVPAFRSVYVMCLMFVGQGFMEGIAQIGVLCIAIRLGGRKRNGMYLQAVCLGVSIGSICGPFIARPFLSDPTNSHRIRDTTWHADNYQLNETLSQNYTIILTEALPILSYNTTSGQLHNTSFGEQPAISSDLDGEEFTKTHVYFYYAIMGVIFCIPAALFCIQYYRSGLPVRNTKSDSSQTGSMSCRNCSAPFSITLLCMFMLSLLQFGTQQTYSNLITTFSVLGPLHFTETEGVYISSLFWTFLCFGRLAGIWIAKYLSAFQILLIDIVIGIIGAIFLIIFSAQSAVVLWIFTAVLGFAYSTTNGAVYSWAANHLPDDTYVIVVLTIGESLGVLVEPTLVTSIFKLTGPMTLMYVMLIGFLAMLSLLVASQLIVVKFGVDGQLYRQSNKRLVEDND